MVEPTILNVGVDTLKLNVKLKEQVQVLPVELEVSCSIWQEQAREQSKPVATPLSFHKARMTMLPNGAQAWKYIIKNNALELKLAARLHLPMIAKATLSSAYLWEVGSVWNAVEELEHFFWRVFGLPLILQVGQLDLCVDLIGLDVPTAWEQVFISHAIGKSPIGESQKDRAFYRGRTLETILFSGHGSPVSCKVYNKTAEIEQKSHKVWFYDLWQRVTRADGSPVWRKEDYAQAPKEKRVPVWRVEFSLERAGLHEMKLEEVYEVLANIKRIWAYCTQDWLRLVIPGKSKNRHRWMTHPTWTLIQRAFDDYDNTPIEGLGPLVRKRQRAADIERGIAQVAGQVTTLAAWQHELDTDVDALDIFQAVYSQVIKRWAERDIDVAAVVQEKRVLYHQVP